MPLDLSQFRGVTPYASARFGVYQPLLGWAARRKQRWIGKHHAALAKHLVAAMVARTPTSAVLATNPHPHSASGLKLSSAEWLDGESARAVRAAAGAFIATNQRVPTAADWSGIVAAARLDDVLARVAARPRAVRGAPGRVERPLSLRRETAIVGTIAQLAAIAPSALSQAFGLSTEAVPVNPMIVDPLANFDLTAQRAVLSPIGLINVFRQYFFEFDTFLGPPVGHVWVSPGGTVEVYETHTRRSLEERSVELSQASTTRIDREASESSELADRITSENSNDTQLGVSIQAGVNMGVFHSSASANFGMQNAQKDAQETAHKRARTQSEKTSSEIRREFKTTFRTSVELTDTSSRRYVLQNGTGTLLNYELRRKMRRVGVQVQHIGTQLCWQLFVDDPGAPLGVGLLVHAAAPSDLIATPPPEAPPALEAKREQMLVTFAFEPLDPEARDDGEDEDYQNGFDVNEDGVGEIQHVKTVKATPPANGYTLDSATVLSWIGTDPGEDPPTKVATTCTPVSKTEFTLTLTYVNFNDQPGINFTVELLWAPPAQSPETMQAYEAARQEYTEESARAAHRAYVQAVRDRVERAGRVPSRDADYLRAEERTVIFRRMIRDLMEVPGSPEPHLMSELLRSIFDVDQMLYYVAQEWWMPRARHGLRLGERMHLDAESRVSWGGDRERGRNNYYVTDESEPAPMGASLGWLLQLDGDAHRNAFLNAPWVKAVLPIRPGREAAAMNWLMQANVEGAEGLDAKYAGPEPELAGKTLGAAALALAEAVSMQDRTIEGTLASETVFENGFDPLEGGFRATGTPFEVFDQWIEVLPTDQVVAVEYLPPPITPLP